VRIFSRRITEELIFLQAIFCFNNSNTRKIFYLHTVSVQLNFTQFAEITYYYQIWQTGLLKCNISKEFECRLFIYLFEMEIMYNIKM
jgi:hypothetical protein